MIFDGAQLSTVRLPLVSQRLTARLKVAPLPGLVGFFPSLSDRRGLGGTGSAPPAPFRDQPAPNIQGNWVILQSFSSVYHPSILSILRRLYRIEAWTSIRLVTGFSSALRTNAIVPCAKLAASGQLKTASPSRTGGEGERNMSPPALEGTPVRAAKSLHTKALRREWHRAHAPCMVLVEVMRVTEKAVSECCSKAPRLKRPAEN